MWTKYIRYAVVAIVFVEFILVILTFTYPQPRSGLPCNVLTISQVTWLDWINNILYTVGWQEITAVFTQIIFLLTLCALFFLFIFRNRFDSKNFNKHLRILMLISLLIGFLFAFENRGGHGPDSRRHRDIGSLRLALELYAYSHKTYPVTSSWQELRDELTSKTCSGFLCIPSVPDDYCFKTFPQHQYSYSSLDGKTYVLKAILSDPSSMTLKTDLDGEILGLWCGEQGKELEYCVSN